MTGKAVNGPTVKRWLTYAQVLTDPTDGFERVYMKSVSHLMDDSKPIVKQEYYIGIRAFWVGADLIPG